MAVTLTYQRRSALCIMGNDTALVSWHSHHIFLMHDNFPPTPLTYTNSISNWSLWTQPYVTLVCKSSGSGKISLNQKCLKFSKSIFSEEAFPTIYGHVTYVSSQSHAPSHVGCLFVNNGTCLFLFSRSYFPVQPVCPSSSSKLRWLMEFSG